MKRLHSRLYLAFAVQVPQQGVAEGDFFDKMPSIFTQVQ